MNKEEKILVGGGETRILSTWIFKMPQIKRFNTYTWFHRFVTYHTQAIETKNGCYSNFNIYGYVLFNQFRQNIKSHSKEIFINNTTSDINIRSFTTYVNKYDCFRIKKNLNTQN